MSNFFSSETDEYKRIIADELNVKNVEFLDEPREAEPWEIMKQDGDAMIYLDTRISEALAEEGLIRDVMRFIQNERKTQGFALNDAITIDYHTTSHNLVNALVTHGDWVSQEVKATEITFTDKARVDGVRKRFGGEELVVHLAHAGD